MANNDHLGNLQDQSVAEESFWTFSVPNFPHYTYTVTLSDGKALPSWLSYNPSTRTVSGTPPANYNGTFEIKVSAYAGLFLVGSDSFDLTVTPVNDAPTAASSGNSAAGTEDTPISGRVPTGSDVDGTGLTYELISPVTGLVLKSDGSFSYQPAANANGTVSFQYRVVDRSGAKSAAQVFTITLAPVNDRPIVAAAKAVSTDEDTVLRAVSIGATDVDGDSLAYSLKSGAAPQKGSVSFDQTMGTFTYSPVANANGPDTFTIVVSDGNGGAAEQVVSVTIRPVNDAPVAPTSRSLSMEEDASSAAIAIGATDLEGDGLAYAVKPDASPQKGSVVFDQAQGTFIYTPVADATGSDSFTIVVSDGKGGTAEQVVSVTIRPSNDAPVLTAKIADQSFVEDTAWSFQIPPGAFTDVDSTLTYTVTLADGAALPGWLTFNPAALTVSGTPPADFDGSVDLRIVASDGVATASDQLRLTVTPGNDAPTASTEGNSATGAEDTVITGRVPAGSDVDGDPLTYELVAPVSGLTFYPDGSFRFEPDSDHNGTFTFRYKVVDPSGTRSAAQTFVLTVSSLNDVPVATGIDLADGTEDTAVRITAEQLLAGSSDVDGDTLTVSELWVVDGGGTLADNGDGTWTYTPAPHHAGPVSFGYAVTDGRASATSMAHLTLDSVNDAPELVAAISDQSVAEDTAWTFQVPGGAFSDADSGLAYTASLANGSELPDWLTFDAFSQTFAGTPPRDFNGSLDLRVAASDGELAASSTFTLTVTPINDAPAGPSVKIVSIDKDTVSTPIIIGATDPEGDGLSYALKAGAEPTKGQVVLNQSDGSFTYTPTDSTADADSFIILITDGRGGSTEQVVKVTLSFEDETTDGLPDTSHDDLIAAGDGDDHIVGGLGSDVMHGEGGNDIVVGGVDNGRLGWSGDRLRSVVVGDNLYGGDGRDTYRYAKGDGIDLIWDFRPGEDVIEIGNYGLRDVVGAAFVGAVSNRVETGGHDKVALLLGSGDAIVFNDYPGLRENQDLAFRFGDGSTLTSADLVDLTQSKPVGIVPGGTVQTAIPASGPGTVATAEPLDLFGNNGEDTLLGGEGNDRLYGNEGVNGLNGRAGNDQLFGGNVRDILLGQDGDDIGYGNGGDDLVVGGDGADTLYGAGGADVIYGDAAEGVDLPAGLLVPAGNGIAAALRIVNTWWGGFQGEITVTANGSMAHWELALRTHFKLDQVWGAETAGEAAGADSSTLYTLDNASWNGALSQGQTTTFGFVARTDIAGTLDVTQILAAVSLATDGVPAELPPLPASGSVDTGIEIVGTWWGGFQGQITITADENVTHWEMLLKSQFKIDSIWGAEKAAEVSSPDGGTLYSLDNAKWNGSLAKGQTATIGFTAQTGINGVMAAEEIKKFITLAEDQGSVTRALNATSGARQVVGGTGSDTLFGSASKDVLTGLSGQDAFVFNTKLNRKTNVDKLTDFSVRDDTIELENAIFKKVGAKTGTLKKDFFRVGDKAKDGNDYVIYDKKKGVLYYDADGSGHGAAVQYATIQKNLKMTYKDLLVI